MPHTRRLFGRRRLWNRRRYRQLIIALTVTVLTLLLGWHSPLLFMVVPPESKHLVEYEWNTTLWLPPDPSSASASATAGNPATNKNKNYNINGRGTTTTMTTESPFRRNVTLPLCLVHIGKAAGSSVSCGLGFTYANCEGMPRDRIPNTHFFHMRRKNCPIDNTSTLLVTLRNPITRIQSWFDFEKNIIPTRNKNQQDQDHIRWKRGLLFIECFSNLEMLARIGLSPLQNLNVTAVKVQDMTCQERAWAAILGVRAFSYHEWYNYEHYWEGIKSLHSSSSLSSRPSLKVLRTEHLQEDWESVSTEKLYRRVNQRPGAPPPPQQRNHPHQHHPKELSNQTSHDNMSTHTTANTNPSGSLLSAQALEQLCRALCPELQIYKQFLDVADNINETQRLFSLQEIQQTCPNEPIEFRHPSSCPNIPIFPLLKVPKRQYLIEPKKRLFQPFLFPKNPNKNKKNGNNNNQTTE